MVKEKRDTKHLLFELLNTYHPLNPNNPLKKVYHQLQFLQMRKLRFRVFMQQSKLVDLGLGFV